MINLLNLLNPEHLYTHASIKYNDTGILSRVANWCYKPCHWTLGRQVVLIDDASLQDHAPVLKIFHKPWVQTCFKVILYIPTLIGRILQEIAEYRDADYKNQNVDARMFTAAHRLTKFDLTDISARIQASKMVRILLPTYEQREILASSLLVGNLVEPSEMEMKAAGFALGYSPGGIYFWANISKFIRTDNPGFNFDELLNTEKIKPLIKALMSDPIEGALNYKKIFTEHNGQPLLFYALGVEKMTEELVSFRNKLIDEAITNLTPAQAQKLAKEMIELGESRTYTELCALTLLKMNFYEMDKNLACKRLLYGHNPNNNGMIDPGKGSIRAEIYKAMETDTIIQLFQEKLFARLPKEPVDPQILLDVQYLSDEMVTRLFKHVFRISDIVEAICKLPDAHCEKLYYLVRNTPEISKKFQKSDWNLLFKKLHESRRIYLLSKDSPSTESRAFILNESFKKSLSNDESCDFIVIRFQVYMESIRKKYPVVPDYYLDIKHLKKVDAFVKIYQHLIPEGSQAPSEEWETKLKEWIRPFNWIDESCFEDMVSIRKAFIVEPLNYFEDLKESGIDVG